MVRHRVARQLRWAGAFSYLAGIPKWMRMATCFSRVKLFAGFFIFVGVLTKSASAQLAPQLQNLLNQVRRPSASAPQATSENSARKVLSYLRSRMRSRVMTNLQIPEGDPAFRELLAKYDQAALSGNVTEKEGLLRDIMQAIATENKDNPEAKDLVADLQSDLRKIYADGDAPAAEAASTGSSGGFAPSRKLAGDSAAKAESGAGPGAVGTNALPGDQAPKMTDEMPISQGQSLPGGGDDEGNPELIQTPAAAARAPSLASNFGNSMPASAARAPASPAGANPNSLARKDSGLKGDDEKDAGKGDAAKAAAPAGAGAGMPQMAGTPTADMSRHMASDGSAAKPSSNSTSGGKKPEASVASTSSASPTAQTAAPKSAERQYYENLLNQASSMPGYKRSATYQNAANRLAQLDAIEAGKAPVQMKGSKCSPKGTVEQLCRKDKKIWTSEDSEELDQLLCAHSETFEKVLTDLLPQQIKNPAVRAKLETLKPELAKRGYPDLNNYLKNCGNVRSLDKLNTRCLAGGRLLANAINLLPKFESQCLVPNGSSPTVIQNVQARLLQSEASLVSETRGCKSTAADSGTLKCSFDRANSMDEISDPGELDADFLQFAGEQKRVSGNCNKNSLRTLVYAQYMVSSTKCSNSPKGSTSDVDETHTTNEFPSGETKTRH